MVNISVELDASKVKLLLERAPEELRAAIELGSGKLLQSMQSTARAIVESPGTGRYPAVAWGNLVRGIDFEGATQPPLGGLLFVKPPADVYALPIEPATRPHWPPPAALLPWIKKKFPGADEQQSKSFAFLIGRKISKVGTPGIFFFERTRQAHQDDAAAVYEEYLDAAIARLEGG